MAVVGLGLAVGALLSKRWIAPPVIPGLPIELNVGLRDAEVCLGPMCQSEKFTRSLTEDDKIFVMLGSMTLGAGIVAAALTAIALALAIFPRSLGPISPARLAILAWIAANDVS